MTSENELLTAVDAPTERRNPRTVGIDGWPTIDILRAINDEDAMVAYRVSEALPVLTELVDATVERIRLGGTVHYFGAGSSGRFGVLDAAEVPPTYGIGAEVIQAHIAGGSTAMTHAVEDAEDSDAAGFAAAECAVGPHDVAIGLAASGRTPYVAGALRAARLAGAVTAVVTSNPAAPLAELADLHVLADTGPEVITGSTRMKAGTAQKLMLHTFSTAVMVRLGHTYSNLMINVVPTNSKLRARVIRMLILASGKTAELASQALDASGGETKTALVMLLTGWDAPRARVALQDSGSPAKAAACALTAAVEVRERSLCAVGVDIGASGYRIAILDPAPSEVSRGQVRLTAGSQGIDVTAVMRAVADDLSRAVPGNDPIAVGVGVAGAQLVGTDHSRLLGALVAVPRVTVAACVGDATAAYAGTLGFQAGAVLAAGTGSVAIGTDAVAEWRRVDGLGYLVGDFGGGAWIGRRGIEAALRHRLGRTSGSAALADALMAQFGSVEELVRTLHTRADRSAILASFVPAVLSAAQVDGIALGILDDAAAELAQTLLQAADGITGELGLAGSLVGPDSPLTQRVAAIVQRNHRVVAASFGSPAVGAARIVAGVAESLGLPGCKPSWAMPTVFQAQVLCHMLGANRFP